MSDSDALLRSIIENPDDDAPRLVYADWLDEHDEAPRAAFIRAQVQLARLPNGHADRLKLEHAERTLGLAHRARWTAWLPAWVTGWEFRRGFVEWLRCPAAAFLAGTDELRRQTPLAGVRLDGGGDVAVAVFRSRALEGLRSLTLSVVVPGRDWRHLGACPYLGRLSELDLTSNDAAPAELVEALVHSDAFPALESLRLDGCHLGDEPTSQLVGHPWAARLRALDLSDNWIAEEGGSALVRSPYLDGLQTLVLRGNPVLMSGPVSAELRARFAGRLRG